MVLFYALGGPYNRLEFWDGFKPGVTTITAFERHEGFKRSLNIFIVLS